MVVEVCGVFATENVNIDETLRTTIDSFDPTCFCFWHYPLADQSLGVCTDIDRNWTRSRQVLVERSSANH
jgi:hypothetical protein